MSLRTSSEYDGLVTKAGSSHGQGRSKLDISAEDIARARLYCYAYRNHTIGAFHATRLAALEGNASDPVQAVEKQRAVETLEDLANIGMEPVPRDFRVVISTFHRYDRGVRRAIDALEHAGETSVSARFTQLMSQIANGNGICLTRDTEVPTQSTFVVPNLDITIVPLVYGDHHSWNLAQLNEQHLDVPWHLHHHGVEIHLGYEPLEGYIIFDRYKSPVNEGYALPIPPQTRHGWANRSGQVHHVPFVFGSLKQAGWGVFLDVQAQPMPLEEFQEVGRESWQMSHTVYLQRQIRSMAAMRTCLRTTIVPASVMDRGGSGGLELSLTRVNETGYHYPSDSFRAVAVVKGRGSLRIGPAEAHIQTHDHFGIPEGMIAAAQQKTNEPLVLLDTVIKTAGHSTKVGPRP